MELVAFDMKDELHEYWRKSSYYGKAISSGGHITIFNTTYSLKQGSSIRNYILLDSGCKCKNVENKFECQEEHILVLNKHFN
jgi:hypothetical protein